MKRIARNIFSLSILMVFLVGMVNFPNYLNINSDSILNIDSPDNIDEYDKNSPKGSAVEYFENIEIAEQTARWLVSESVQSGEEMHWVSNGRSYINYEDGASGIGIFFLNLFQQTLNETYLNWAIEIGNWLTSIDSTYNYQGKWPSYVGESNSANYTGIQKGSAGVGKFLCKLYDHTHNSTIKALVEEISDYIVSMSVISENQMASQYMQQYEQQDPNTLPKENDGSSIKVSAIEGTVTGSNDLFTRPSDYQTLNPNSTTGVYLFNNASSLTTISLSNSTVNGTNGQNVSQSFHFSKYPVFIDPVKGIKLHLYSNSTNGTGQLVLSVYHADEYGKATNTKVGDSSNAVKTSEVSNNLDGPWVTFNWTANAPILNGSSKYGYTFVVEFVDGANWMDNQTFFLKTTTASNYKDGSMHINGIFNNERDLAFDIHPISDSSLLSIAYELNISQFSIPTFIPEEITNITLSFTLSSTDNSAITGLQIWNYDLSRWELVEFFDQKKEIKKTLKNEVQSYFSNDQIGRILFNVMGSNNDSLFSVYVHQLNISVGYIPKAKDYSWGSGIAGLSDFYLDCYNCFAEEEYLAYATLLGNYLLNETTFNYWPHTYGRDISYLSGDSGIISLLLRLAEHNSTTSIYLDKAYASGKYIAQGGSDIISYSRYGVQQQVKNWESVFGIKHTGSLIGISGVGELLLDLANRFQPVDYLLSYNFYTVSKKIGSLLEAKNVTISNNNYRGPLVENYNQIAFYTDILEGTEVHYTYYDGMIGCLSFLNKLQNYGYTTDYAGLVGNGLRYLKESMLPQGYWNLNSSLNNTDHSNYGLFYGMAGIGNEIHKIQIRANDAQTTSNLINIVESSNINSENQPGLSTGIAGMGLSFLENYQLTKNNTYFEYATQCAEKLLDVNNWKEETTGWNHTGLGSGFAGIGLFFIEMYRATNLSIYLNRANYAANELIKIQNNGCWCNDPVEEVYYNGFIDGTAGIIYYILEMYQTTKDSNYLSSAEWGLATLMQLRDLDDQIWSTHNESLDIINGYFHGVAGIADVFIKAYEVTNNITYLSVARNATNTLCSNYNINKKFYHINTAAEKLEYVGLENGYAGFFRLLKHILLYGDIGNYRTTLESAINQLLYGLGTRVNNVGRYLPDSYTSGGNPSSTIPNLSYCVGMTSVLDELQQLSGFIISSFSNNKQIFNLMLELEDYISNSSFSTPTPGYYYGYGGVSVVMNKMVDRDYPEKLSFNLPNPSNPEYDQTINLEVMAQDFGSSISSVQILYYINKSMAQIYSAQFTQNLTLPNMYEYSLGPFPYNYIIDYYVIIEDHSKVNYMLVNESSNEPFSLVIQDTTGPYIENGSATCKGIYPTLVYGKNGYGGGVITVDVFEPAYASGLKNVYITYMQSNTGETNSTTMTRIGLTNKFTHTIDTNKFNLNASNTLLCNITATDYAGKKNGTQEYEFIIGDYDNPQFLHYYKTALYPKYETTEAMEIEVMLNDNHTNGGSGLQRVYLKYSQSISETPDKWQEINLTKEEYLEDTTLGIEGFIYHGAIPPQEPAEVIWYYVCAVDGAGNEVAYDKFGNIVPIDEIPLDLWYYSVYRNWMKIVIYVAIAVSVAVVGYLIYTRRGTYLDRMRREAGSTANLVAIKEIFSSYYYAFMEWLTRFGDKSYDVIRAASIREKIEDWLQDHINSPFVKIAYALGGMVKTYLKYLLFAVVSPFYITWKIIVGTKGRQMMITSLIGVGLIVASVVKYFGSDVYPLRAMFFIDFGFGLFIGSFSLIIIHLIYEIAYK